MKMAGGSVTNANSSNIVPETRVVDEIPDEMKRLASTIARGFYGPEHALVIDYIKRNTCIKEDVLRDMLKFDQKRLRTVLIQLKQDKLLKERVVSEVQHQHDNRSRKFNYYFINYRAVLNVTKYKLDHMRQKLESREKDNTHRASFKCTGCKQSYDSMEIDKIFDPFTQQMACWRCKQQVVEDETAGPNTATRSSLARFNEQMAPLFGILQALDGVQLAPHLLEPPTPMSIQTMENANQLAADSTARRVVPGLGGTAQTVGGGSFDMYGQPGITVDIEGSLGGSAASDGKPTKEVPSWLQDTSHAETVQASLAVMTSPNRAQQFSYVAHDNGGGEQQQQQQQHEEKKDIVADLLQHELLGDHHHHVSAPVKRPKLETADDVVSTAEEAATTSDVNILTNNISSPPCSTDKRSSDEEEESDEEETQVSVQGVNYRLSAVSSDPAMIAKMTVEERQAYVKAVQEHVQGQHEFD